MKIATYVLASALVLPNTAFAESDLPPCIGYKTTMYSLSNRLGDQIEAHDADLYWILEDTHLSAVETAIVTLAQYQHLRDSAGAIAEIAGKWLAAHHENVKCLYEAIDALKEGASSQ